MGQHRHLALPEGTHTGTVVGDLTSAMVKADSCVAIQGKITSRPVEQ
ncbi:hypothetical protein [Alistipes sp.]